MTEIVMPELSASMEEGTILKWLKRDGEDVALDEDLLEIETDKATMTYAAEAEGMLEILAAEGTTHPVGALIGKVGVRAAAMPPGRSDPETFPRKFLPGASFLTKSRIDT